MIPNEYEIEVMKMIQGTIPWEQGAWVNACYEFLQEGGFIQRGGVLRIHQLTDKGQKFMEELNEYHSLS